MSSSISTFSIRFENGGVPIPNDLKSIIPPVEWGNSVFSSFDYFPEVCTDDQNYIELSVEQSGALYKEIHSTKILLDNKNQPTLNDGGIAIESLSNFTGKIGFAYFHLLEDGDDEMFFFNATFVRGMFLETEFVEKIKIPGTQRRTSIKLIKEKVIKVLARQSHPLYRYVYVPWSCLVRCLYFMVAYLWNLPARALYWLVYKVLTPI